MKYRVRLRDKFYEVEVVEGEAVLLDSYDAAPVAPTASAPATPAASAPTTSAPSAPVAGGDSVTSPLPGTVLDIKVSVGDSVKSGQVLVVIEAMKMENEIVAPSDGTVKAVHTSKGSAVETGAPLITIG